MTNRPKAVEAAIKWMDEAAFNLYPCQLGADYHTILNYINQLESTQPVQGWQDISTAPKDGRLVLVWDGESAVVAYRATVSYYRPSRYSGVNLEPTHWMPLPPSPTTGDM